MDRLLAVNQMAFHFSHSNCQYLLIYPAIFISPLLMDVLENEFSSGYYCVTNKAIANKEKWEREREKYDGNSLMPYHAYSFSIETKLIMLISSANIPIHEPNKISVSHTLDRHFTRCALLGEEEKLGWFNGGISGDLFTYPNKWQFFFYSGNYIFQHQQY